MEIELPDIHIPFPRYSYSELIDKLQKNHKYIRWGDDISPKILKDIVADSFYYIIDWPLSTKPFYVKPKIDNDATMVQIQSILLKIKMR